MGPKRILVFALSFMLSGCAGVSLSKTSPKGLFQAQEPAPTRGPAMAKPPGSLRVPAGNVVSAAGMKWPLRRGSVSSYYGVRGGRYHDGLDIRAARGTPIYAVKSGVVIYSGRGIRGYGNLVIIRHDNQVATIYAHNSKNLVKRGKRVRQGEKIALVGSTGRSTGPHLHFEVRVNEQPQDPLAYLATNSKQVAVQDVNEARSLR